MSTNMSELPYTIAGVIQEFVDDSARITLENQTPLIVPKSLIAESATVGSTIHIAIFSENDIAAEHERLAKAVLQEMLRLD